jgi:hypothetical protein
MRNRGRWSVPSYGIVVERQIGRMCSCCASRSRDFRRGTESPSRLPLKASAHAPDRPDPSAVVKLVELI